MGEAKRRKKLLGKDYGKKLPVLVKGSYQFEKHFQQFLSAWNEKLKELGEVSELEEEFVKIKQQEIDQWLNQYLEKYQEVDREKLVMEILNPVYAKLIVPIQRDTITPEWALNWSLEALSLYKMFKPYLSASSDQNYAKPIKGFYETVITGAIKNAEKELQDQEDLKKLKQLFEETLAIEESEDV